MDAPDKDQLREALGRGGSLSPLPATAQEAEAIRALTVADRSLFALDFEASRATFEDPEIDDFGILHFATHGILDSEQPELSGLVLSMVDEEGRPIDGFIRTHELYSRRLKAELVVMSACKTGRGRVVRGEGLIGLPRGFLYAGVPRVVVSLWNVADHSTALLMTSFYRHLEAGAAPAAALRKAQLEMLRGGNDPNDQLPFHWAPFIFVGDWTGDHFSAGAVGQDDDGTVVLTDGSKGGGFDEEGDSPSNREGDAHGSDQGQEPGAQDSGRLGDPDGDGQVGHRRSHS